MAADSDVLRAKIALEQELVRPLGQALAAYIALWVRSESRIPFWETVSARTSIEAVLMRHYARCCYVVRGIKPPREARLDDAALDAQHREALAARAHRQSLRYMQSIDRELARAADAVGLTQKEMAAHYETKADDKKPWSVWMSGKLKETAQTAWRKVKARMRAIVNNETQEAVEGAIFRWVKQKHANARIYKRWETMKDDRVRHPPKSAFDHVAAQDQEVLVSQPFIVSGERLMFPGDSTLGASLANIVNCRCHSAYTAVGDDGRRVDIRIHTPKIPARRTWRRGDKPGAPTPIRATEAVTLNGTTDARVVLGDGRTIARMHQETPGTIVVSIGRDVVARARVNTRAGTVQSVQVAAGREPLGIEELIRRSVTHSAEHLRRVSP